MASGQRRLLPGAEKAGFRCEGILRAAAVKNGKIRDMKMYSRLKED